MENEDVFRVYSEKDNSINIDFTDVLDSVYSHVIILLSSGSVLNFSIPYFSVVSFMHFNLSGLSSILIKKDLFRLNSGVSMHWGDMQQDNKDVLPANYVLQPVQLGL